MDRLTSASNGYGTVSFGYDAIGNRVSMDSLLYTYNDMDELLSIEEAGGDTDYTFTYDVNGNTLSKASDTDEWLFQYDGANRLTGVQHNSQIVGAYVYDGDGQRIKKTEWNPDLGEYETIIYLYSLGDVCYERNMTPGIDAIYIYGPNGKLAKKVGEEIMYYHSDHLGSTRLLTDGGGNPVTAIGYYPFGSVEDLTGQKERYLFTGQEIDSTGLYYCSTRYYDPEIGRFITRDTWVGDQKNPQTFNKYVYCLNNPLKYKDPSGKGPTGDPEMDELIEKAREEQSSSDSDEEFTDWAEIGRVLGYIVGGIIADKFVNESGISNLYESVKRKTRDQLAKELKEEYGLTNEQVAEFRAGFDETVQSGIENWNTEKYDEVFKDAKEGVQALIKDVTETLAKCMWASGFSFPVGGPKDLFTYIDALKNAYEAGSALNIAWDNIPESKPPQQDAAQGMEMVILGIAVVAIYRKRKIHKEDKQ